MLVTPLKNCWFVVGCVLLTVGGLSNVVRCCSQDLPFTVPEGFNVQKVADDSLAHDCFCMTLDGMGRPVISGPGYIKTLLDDNNDGVYEREIVWTTQVKQGAQGLWSEGRYLYWVADGGLWKSEDANGDLAADASVKKVLDLPTGGEHDAHAIRRGPDGFWYLIAGNFAANMANLGNDANAPLPRPRAGTLWRISPDFSSRAAWAHGLRNCYDFDFMPDGQIVTYDSDDEREATLPWYRPTRVMVLGPGSDAGWCGSAWKDEDHRVTMPQVIARLGRGSPTGVAVYQHDAFPLRYHNAVFAMDWTFGRVLAIYPASNLSDSQQQPGRIPWEVFLQPNSNAGFAPTDLAVCPDGSLLISVGGRGTTGALYRVVSTGSTANEKTQLFATAIRQELLTQEHADSLQAVLTAPCPWESWSEFSWRPKLTQALAVSVERILDGQISMDADAEKVACIKQRCAQVITRVGGKLKPEAIARLAASPSPATRAAAWWLAGRGAVATKDEQSLQRSMKSVNKSQNDEVTRWEAHLGASDGRLCWECVGLKRWSCADEDSFRVTDLQTGHAMRRTWLWALSRSNIAPTRRTDANVLDVQTAKLLFSATATNLDVPIFETLTKWLPSKQDKLSTREQLELLTIMQAALGDRRQTLPLQGDSPADSLDGYRGLHVNKLSEGIRNSWATWALYLAKAGKEQSHESLFNESLRTMAMFEPSDIEPLDYLVNQIDANSHPTADIHILCCMAQCSTKRSAETTRKCASALANIVRKVKDRGLYTDNQWPTRLQQLVAALVRRDTLLGSAFVELPVPCCTDDLVLINSFPLEVQTAARRKMREHLIKTPVSEWTSPILRYAAVLGLDDEFAKSIRLAVDDESMKPACIELLAAAPKDNDYELFLKALEGDDKSLWPNAWKGLATTSTKHANREFPVLAKLFSASLNSSIVVPRPAVLNRIRSVASELTKSNLPNTENWSEWNAFFESNLDATTYGNLIQPNSKVDWREVLKSATSLNGSPEAGRVLFNAKCVLCHGGQSSLGPSLVGVAKRFSRDDLAKAIFEPSRDISDRYRAVRVLTVDDEIITGMNIYNAADGITLQAADGTIKRINQENIRDKGYSTESIMPTGLLDDKSANDVADLFAYLNKL